MPAPHRRNKGDSLAQKIKSKAGAKTVSDDRDNLVATRVRQAKKWDEAAASLSPALRKVAEEVKDQQSFKSDLAERAEQTRLDYARGRQYEHYVNKVKSGRAKPPVVVLTPEQPPRYLLICWDCSGEIRLHRPEPRVPLCKRCRAKRERRS